MCTAPAVGFRGSTSASALLFAGLRAATLACVEKVDISISLVVPRYRVALNIPRAPSTEQRAGGGHHQRRNVQPAGVVAENLPKAFSALVDWKAHALTTLNDGMFFGRRGRIVELSAQHALPAIHPETEFVHHAKARLCPRDHGL